MIRFCPTVMGVALPTAPASRLSGQSAADRCEWSSVLIPMPGIHSHSGCRPRG